MGRRGENIRRRADGRWEARIVQGSPVDGRTNYKFLYAKTYQEAKRLKKAYFLALETGNAAYVSAGAVPGNPAMGLSAGQAAINPAMGQITRQAAVNPAKGLITGQAAGNYTMGHLTEQTPGTSSLLTEAADKGMQDKPQALFREAAEGWLSAKKATVKESTFSYYTVMVHNHILPELGDLALEEMTPQRLTAFLMDKKAGGRLRDGQPMKDKTVADIKAVVRQILNWASLHELMERAPVCPVVPVRQAPTEVLTRQEQSRLEAQLLEEDTPFCLGVWLTLYGGPRIGEVCALKWEDIDFANGTVQIHKTISRITDVDSGTPAGTKLIVSSPKTEYSMRSIPLPEAVCAYLKERKKPGQRYVMTGTNHFLEPRSCLARLKRLLKRAGVREYTWHALRHTFATRCVESGVDVKSLSEIMGHSDVKITMQRYVHPSMDAKKYQVNKLSCRLGEKESSGQSSQD